MFGLDFFSDVCSRLFSLFLVWACFRICALDFSLYFLVWTSCRICALDSSQYFWSGHAFGFLLYIFLFMVGLDLLSDFCSRLFSIFFGLDFFSDVCSRFLPVFLDWSCFRIFALNVSRCIFALDLLSVFCSRLFFVFFGLDFLSDVLP